MKVVKKENLIREVAKQTNNNISDVRLIYNKLEDCVFDILSSVGKVKVNAETDIIIDDHLGNLDASAADTKILFSMFHNRDLKVGDAFRSNDYNAIVKHVKEVVCCEKC